MFHVVIPIATTVTTLTGLQYVGLLVAVGALIFTAAVLPAQDASTIAHRPFMLIAVTGSALAVVATILLIPVTALQIAQEPLNAIFRPALWQPLMIDAHVAVLLVITAGLASALLTQANFSSGGSGNTLWLRVLVSLLALAALIGPILTGHTQSMKPAWLMQVSDFVHLAAGAFWLGGVICLGVFMHHAQSMSHAVLAGVVSRFSSLASVSVLALTVSGVVMAAIISDSWASLTATDFGTTLGAKLLLVTAVLVFAVWNKFRLVPALNSTTPLAGAQGASLSKPNNTELLFRRTIMWEAVLLLAVGLVSGILTHTNPHSATPPPAASMESTQEPATSTTVPARDPNESSPISTPQAPVEMMVEEGGLHVHGYLDLGTTGVNTYKYEIFTGGAFSIYENVEFEIFAPGTAPDNTANPVTRVVPRVDGETEYSYADFNFTEPGDWRVDVLVPITTERTTRLSMWARIPQS